MLTTGPLDLTNPNTDPEKIFESYLRVLIKGRQICHLNKPQICHLNKINHKYEIVPDPQIRSHQLENQLYQFKDKEEITATLICVWKQAGWIEESGEGYLTPYGWLFSITPEGLKIVNKIIKEENEKEPADK